MKIRKIEFYDSLDRNEEMELSIECNGSFDFVYTWINKEEAELIIDHLKSKFEID